MPSLILVNCLSPVCWRLSRLLQEHWSVLTAGRSLLNASTPYLPTFQPPTDFIGNAQPFYTIADLPLPEKALFRRYGDIWHYLVKPFIQPLTEGSSLFLFTAGENYDPLRVVLDQIITRSGLRDLSVSFLLLYGNPELFLEQRCRCESGGQADPGVFARYMDADFARPSVFLEKAARDWGRENVVFFDDGLQPPFGNVLPEPDGNWLNAFFDRLGWSSVPSGPPAEGFFLDLQSAQARRIWQRLFQGSNAWPVARRASSAVMQELMRDAALALREAERQVLRSSPGPLSCGPVLSPRHSRLIRARVEQHLPAGASLPESQETFPPEPAESGKFSGKRRIPEDRRALELLCRNLDTEILAALTESGVVDAVGHDDAGQRITAVAQETLAARTGRRRHRNPSAGSRVSVVTFTRDQEDYIVQNMESVLNQRVRFPLEHIIVDDHSADGTRRIIADYARKYPHIHPVFLKDAVPWAGLAIWEGFNRARSPYVALLDGDDYFFDPEKLQMQVDFLDAHPDCGLCFHPVLIKYEGDESRAHVYPPPDLMPGGIRDRYGMGALLHGNPIQTGSVMYRWRFPYGLPDWFDPTLLPGDWYWHFLHAECGKLGFINRIMSVYRRHANALFLSAEKDGARHHIRFGMEELRLYATLNRHFQGKYFRQFHRLASGVLDCFRQVADQGDSHLLEKARRAFPEFGPTAPSAPHATRR